MKFTQLYLVPCNGVCQHSTPRQESGYSPIASFCDDGNNEYPLREGILHDLASAEKLGFDGVALRESRSSDDIGPSASKLIAAALATSTSRIRIVLFQEAALCRPQDAYKVAADLAMIDVLSNGRLVVGFEFSPASDNPVGSDARSNPYRTYDSVISSWHPIEKLQDRGAKIVQVFPKPIQRPFPTVWIAPERSIKAIQWAASPERRYSLVAPFSTRENIAQTLKAYRMAANEFGYEPASEKLGWAMPIIVAKTDSDALGLAEKAIGMPFYHSKKFGTSVCRARSSLKGFARKGAFIAGSPETVKAEIAKIAELTGAGNLICLFRFGGISADHVEESVQLFATKVIPGFRFH